MLFLTWIEKIRGSIERDLLNLSRRSCTKDVFIVKQAGLVWIVLKYPLVLRSISFLGRDCHVVFYTHNALSQSGGTWSIHHHLTCPFARVTTHRIPWVVRGKTPLGIPICFEYGEETARIRMIRVVSPAFGLMPLWFANHKHTPKALPSVILATPFPCCTTRC